jgi:SNF2 family DNA or RNA helicase
MAQLVAKHTLEFVPPPAVPWVPHDYQKKAIKFLLEHGSAGLFLDPGLGKTSITLAAFKILKAQGLVERALIVAPLRVCYAVWPREVEKWADFGHLKVTVLHGAGKEKALKDKSDIFVINPEGLEWLCTDGRMKALGVDTLVIDESSKFKHTGTRRFKTLKPTLHRFRRRWILTGTPAPNGLMDLFGQVYILDLGNALGPYITKFRSEFFTPAGFGGYSWVPKPDTDVRITELLKPLTLRLAAEDYLTLPKLVENNIYVDLPAESRRIYNDLETEMLSVLDSMEVVTALSAAAASVKCRQVANGGIFLQLDHTPALHSDKWQNLHTAKTDAVSDLIEELNGQQVLLAYDFEHDRDRLRKALPTAIFASDYSAKKFSDVERAWNAGDIPILCGHPQSLGHGLNLQSIGQHIVWHSLTWDLELYLQFIRRILRQGNPNTHVFCHHIVARNTVDEALLRAMKSKAKVQNRLLDALKEYREIKFIQPLA